MILTLYDDWYYEYHSLMSVSYSMNIVVIKTSLSVTYSMNIIEINPLIFVSHSKIGIDIQHEYHSNKSTNV